MADIKVSALTELLGASLDPEADSLLVSDMSVQTSKRMRPSELLRAAAYQRSSVYDFTTGRLGPMISFTRASTGWHYDSAGALAAKATDVPRFQYDRLTLTPRGLLIEATTTNYFPQSDALNDAGWIKARATIQADGYGTMDKLIETAEGSTHNVARVVPVTIGTSYCFEVLAKADTRSWLSITLQSLVLGGAGTNRHYFNLGTGALGGGTVYSTEYIEHLGGGIYRCAITFTCLGTTAVSSHIIELATANTVVSYVGDGSSGLYLGGMSFTDCAAITSPIPTTTAAVTRAADVALITNPDALIEQCWIVKARTPRKFAGSTTNYLLQMDDGTANNARFIYYGPDSRIYAGTTHRGSGQALFDLGAVAADTDFAIAVRWADNNFAASINGGAMVTDLSGTNPSGLTTARIGTDELGYYWNSTIKSIETRRTATDAELPTLSV